MGDGWRLEEFTTPPFKSGSPMGLRASDLKGCGKGPVPAVRLPGPRMANNSLQNSLAVIKHQREFGPKTGRRDQCSTDIKVQFAALTGVLTIGTLPPGLTLSASGLIIGTAIAQGVFTFDARAQDDVQITEQGFSIQVLPGGAGALFTETIIAGNSDILNDGTFVVANDLELTRARMALVIGVRTVVASGLRVMGVDPVDELRA